jgi:hypothetical protein
MKQTESKILSYAVAHRPYRSPGRFLAIISCALPWIDFGLLMAASLTQVRTDANENRIFETYEIVLLSSAACGVVALLGMFRWGHKNVWAPATLGIAFSVFFLGMSHSGP